MKKRKYITIALFILLVGSVLCNIILFKISKNFYKREQLIRLFPTYNIYKNDSHYTLEDSTIVLFGDSRIKNWAPAFKHKNYEIVNLGIGGETTSEMLIRLEKDVLEHKPYLVIIQGGINDLKTIGALPELKSEIIEQCKSNLENILRRLSEKNIKVVFISIFPISSIPVYRKPFMNKTTIEAISEVNKYINNLDIEDLYYFNADDIFYISELKVNPGYYSDVLHINSTAYKQLNNNLNIFITDIDKK